MLARSRATSPRLVIHAGMARSGAWTIQDALIAHRKRLAQRGVLVPAAHRRADYLVAVDALGLTGEATEADASEGAWDRLVAQARAHDGLTVTGHPAWVAATSSQIESLVERADGVPLDVVFTVRDLATHVVSYQAGKLRAGVALSADDLVAEVRNPDSELWAEQAWGDVVRRWAEVVGRERTHVVVVQPGDTWANWRLLAEALGCSPWVLPRRSIAPEPRGLAQSAADLLVQMNREPDLPEDFHRRDAWRTLVFDVLPTLTARHRLLRPDAAVEPELVARTQSWTAALTGDAAIATVHGRLARLTPRDFAEPAAEHAHAAEYHALAAPMLSELLVRVTQVVGEPSAVRRAASVARTRVRRVVAGRAGRGTR